MASVLAHWKILVILTLLTLQIVNWRRMASCKALGAHARKALAVSLLLNNRNMLTFVKLSLRGLFLRLCVSLHLGCLFIIEEYPAVLAG